MYVTNTHLKPVIGIDIHFVFIPFPCPLPHPYIGLVIDPFDYIPFIGSTVSVNGVPRGITSTMGRIITLFHIPFGAGFVMFPIIGHDSQNFFGSLTVVADGQPLSGAGYMNMTCNDIGIPLSVQPGKKMIPIPSLYLPTSFTVPLQWGKPVMVAGPLVPNFDLMSLLKGYLMGGFMKLFGKIAGKVFRRLKKLLPKKTKRSPKPPAKKTICKSDPVDIISGRVTYEYLDFELPGPIPLRWERVWDSDSHYSGSLGYGQSLAFERAIELFPDDDALVLELADGRAAAFPMIQPGSSFYHPMEKLTLNRKQNGNFLLEDHNDQLYFHFNHRMAGTERYQLSLIENYGGARIQMHYNGSHLNAMTDSAGRKLFFRLNEKGCITRVEVTHQSTRKTLVKYEYNKAGDLTGITDALEQSTVIEYDALHRMAKKTDRNGQSFYWEYDRQGRCIASTGDGGWLDIRIIYQQGHNIVTNSLGETTTYHYNNDNLIVQETDAYGNSKYTEYTEEGETYREIDEEGNVVGYIYDDLNRLKEKVMPDGNSIRFAYTEDHQPSLVIYPDGSSETYGYDEQKRLNFVNYANGQYTAYAYDDEGNVTELQSRSGLKTRMEYDADGNISTIHFPDGAKNTWRYDALGQVLEAVNTDGQIRRMAYDELGRLRSLHLPDGNTLQMAYNAYEEVTEVKDKYQQIKFEYNPLGSITKRKAGGQEIQFNYDTENRLLGLVNEAGKHYRFGYNERGEITRETGFDGLERTYERDKTGLVVRTRRPGNRHTDYTYDSNGRLVRAEHQDGTWEIYRYDKNGNLAEAANEFSTVKFSRNKMGLVEAVDQDGYKINYSYDGFGSRTSITSSLGAQINLERDKLGALTGVEAKLDELIWAARFKYNEAGQELERILPGGLNCQWKYDHAGRPAEQRLNRGGVLQSWKKYKWDSADRLTEIFDAMAQTGSRFAHNSAGDLVWAQYADNSIIHRQTDDTGNIYETKDKTDRKYNTAGALLESEKFLYKYDEEGNLLSKTDKRSHKKWLYEWYANGMLKKVVRPDEAEVLFKYDALGRRVEKLYKGRITRWVWDGDTPLHEWTYAEAERPQAEVDELGEISYNHPEPTANAITWVFDEGSFAPAARLQNGESFSIITNHLGTPTEAWNEAGERVWECTLDIYGRSLTLKGEKDFVPFRYQGQYEDAETGLYYNRFRYYAPEEGMYLSQDPIGLLSDNPTLYGYVSEPNALTDPLGLSQTYQLAKALTQANRPLQPGQTAHHIVQINNPSQYARMSRELLARNGLHPDVAANGARLWGTSPTQRALPNHPGKAAAIAQGNYHAGPHIHSEANDKLIYRILRNAEKKGLNVENVLGDIGRRMESGNWKKTIGCH